MLVTAITCNTRTFVVQAHSGPQRDHAPLPVCYPSPSIAPSRRRQWGNYKYKLSGHHGKFSLWLIWQDGEKQPIAECDKQAVACSDSIMSILDAESHRYIFYECFHFVTDLNYHWRPTQFDLQAWSERGQYSLSRCPFGQRYQRHQVTFAVKFKQRSSSMRRFLHNFLILHNSPSSS